MGKQTERKASLSWDMAPFEAAEDRILDAAALAEQTFPLAHLLWCKLQQSAQRIDDGGRFEISRGRLAKLGETDLGAIDALLAAFVEVGLIVDGKLTTFVERGLSRDQRYRAKPKPEEEEAAQLGAVDRPTSVNEEPASRPRRGNQLPRRGRDAEAPDRDAGASRNNTESSESSPSGTIRITEHPSPSSSHHGPAREEATTTTNEGILEVVFSKIDQAKMPPDVVRKGLPVLRDCLADGCDLRLDVVPTLADIAVHLARPLRIFSADWVSSQIRAHRDKRLAAPSAPRGSPAEGESLFASDSPPNFPRGAQVDWEAELIRMRAEGHA